MACLSRRWVPVQERSRSLSLVYSGMHVGSILGLALSPTMVQALGWPSVFYVFGSLGIGWFAYWQRRAASTPAEDPLCTQGEQQFINGNTVAPVRPTLRPRGLLLSVSGYVFRCVVARTPAEVPCVHGGDSSSWKALMLLPSAPSVESWSGLLCLPASALGAPSMTA